MTPDTTEAVTNPSTHVSLPKSILPPQSLDPHALLITEALLRGHAAIRNAGAGDLKKIELGLGAAVHAGVSEEQLTAWSDIYRNAQVAFYGKLAARRCDPNLALRILAGPNSHVVDHRIDIRGMSLLINHFQKTGELEKLLDMIDKGPEPSRVSKGPEGSQAWDNPQTPLELVASIVRMAELNHVAKKRIRVSPELREWVRGTLSRQGYDTRPRIGAMGGIATALAQSLHHIPFLIATGRLASAVKNYLHASTLVVGDDPTHQFLSQLPTQNDPGNFPIEIKGSASYFPPSVTQLKINGKLHPVSKSREVQIVIATASSTKAYEALDPERLSKIAHDIDLHLRSGMHKLNTDEDISRYVASMSAIHGAGAPVALCYSDTSYGDREAYVWKALRDSHSVDYLGINTLEGLGILSRMLNSVQQGNPLGLSREMAEEIAATIRDREHPHKIWNSEQESPDWVFKCADVLQRVLEIPLVRVRARACDAIVADSTVRIQNPEQVRDALVMSRLVGAIKAASENGIPSETELGAFIMNVPPGTHLAALQVVNDLVAKTVVADPLKHSPPSLPYCGYMTMDDGRTIFIAPPVAIYNDRGGTAGLGDGMELVFCTEANEVLHEAHAAQIRAQNPN